MLFRERKEEVSRMAADAPPPSLQIIPTTLQKRHAVRNEVSANGIKFYFNWSKLFSLIHTFLRESKIMLTIRHLIQILSYFTILLQKSSFPSNHPNYITETNSVRYKVSANGIETLIKLSFNIRNCFFSSKRQGTAKIAIIPRASHTIVNISLRIDILHIK